MDKDARNRSSYMKMDAMRAINSPEGTENEKRSSLLYIAVATSLARYAADIAREIDRVSMLLDGGCRGRKRAKMAISRGAKAARIAAAEAERAAKIAAAAEAEKRS